MSLTFVELRCCAFLLMGSEEVPVADALLGVKTLLLASYH